MSDIVLPKNVEYINWILKTLETRPYLWIAANTSEFAQLEETIWRTAFEDAINNIPSKYRNQVSELDHYIRSSTSKLSNNAAWMARGAIVALVAYDDCEQYINLEYKKLAFCATLYEIPQAVLLLPMVYVKEEFYDKMVTPT